jgi:hypothetical protein
VAGVGVQIVAAVRAKSFAVGAAKRSRREGQKHLLPQNIFEHQTTFLIITDFSIGRAQGAFGGAGVDAERAEEEVEIAAERVADRLEATGARDFKVAGPVSAGADVSNNFFRTAVLAEELGVALDGEGADLESLVAVVDGAGREAEVKADRLAFEVEQGDEHGNFRIQVTGYRLQGRVSGRC